VADRRRVKVRREVGGRRGKTVTTVSLEAEIGARIIASGGPSRTASTSQLTTASGNSATR
jgi:hypothetical protein